MNKFFITETNYYKEEVPEIWERTYNDKTQAVKDIVTYLTEGNLCFGVEKEEIESCLLFDGFIFLGKKELCFTIQLLCV